MHIHVLFFLGLHLINGTTIGLDLLREIQRETQGLAEFCITFTDINEENLDKIKDALTRITTTFEEHEQAIQCLQDHQKELETKSDSLAEDVRILYDRTEHVKVRTHHITDRVERVEDDLKGTKSSLAETVESLKDVANEGVKTKQAVEVLKTDFEHMTKNMSDVRPKNKPFFYPPDRLKCFIGREDEITKIETEFLNQENRTYTQVICGLGGIGKTSLSVEICWRLANFYIGGVFWMTAETEEILDNCIQRLAIDVNTTSTTTRETLYKTLTWLSKIQDQWLLVIDNIDVEDLNGSVRDLVLGTWKRESKGHILITSRREVFSAEEVFNVNADDCTSLEVLSSEESIKFMQIRTEKDRYTEACSLEELVAELGGLPLALEQAAAHIKNLKCTFPQYLNKFRNKRLKLLRKVENKTVTTDKARLSVQTTWQLNFEYIAQKSEENDLEKAAVYFLEISSFLFADDIPVEILNVGSPDPVSLSDLYTSLQDDLSCNQIFEILTQFSLFQRRTETSIAVHRLVQEVVRDRILDEAHKGRLLQSALRMTHFALERCMSPNDLLNEECVTRGTLQMWSRLAAHANSLMKFILMYCENSSESQYQNIYFTVEMARILQTCAISHSLFQRQNEALAAQAHMINVITQTTKSEFIARDLTKIKVPLLQKDRALLENGTASVLTTNGDDTEQPVVASDSEKLRMIGNEEFKSERYQHAILYYTEALRACGQMPDPRVLSNRSLSYLRCYDYENCIKDADRCIEISPSYIKAYCWKAYAIAGMIRLGTIPENWESVGLAAASIAGHLDAKCLLDYRMKIEYPVIRFQLITEDRELKESMFSLFVMSFTTFLFKRGRYTINTQNIITKKYSNYWNRG